MNNLKELREIAGLTQRELAAMVQHVDSRIDNSMISEFESGKCLPMPIVADALANALQTSTANLFGEEVQTYIRDITASETPVAGLPFEVEDLLNELHEFPRTRKELREALDVPDRKLRLLIAKARKCGYVIRNAGRGDGYYLTTSIEDMTKHYRREHGRAMNILETLKPLRRQLKELGVDV